MLLNVQMSLAVACTFIPSLSVTGRIIRRTVWVGRKSGQNSRKALILLEVVLEFSHTQPACLPDSVASASVQFIGR